MEASKSTTGPKDVFLHLLSIILLYFAAFNIGVLLFQYINIYIPDIISEWTASPDQYFEPLRWAIATLIIVFPIYMWSIWYLEKDYRQFPEKKQLRTRKWLYNFTLFATALVIIGDLVAAVFQFLQGELSARFYLKILSILLIAASIFIYYFWSLRKPSPQWTTYLVWFQKGIMLVVAGLVVGGFFVIGSPQQQRLVRFDSRKINDLQMIQSQIIYFWQTKEQLPQSLDDLNDSVSGFQTPLDPQTQTAYEYQVRAELVFELCTSFNLPSQVLPQRETMSVKGEPENWQHQAGYTCFERTIDPDLYPPIEDASIKPLPALVR